MPHPAALAPLCVDATEDASVADFFHRNLLDNLYDGVYFVDPDRTITYWNKGAERLTGYGANEAVSRHCFDNFLMHVDKAGCALCLSGCPLSKTLADGEHREMELFLRHKQGHRVPVQVRIEPIRSATGSVAGAVAIFTDISAVKKLERLAGHLVDLAYYDSLTQVANRRHLEMKVQQALQEVRQFGRGFGIVMLDVDSFKNVNDKYGHQTGDRLLKLLCDTLTTSLRPGDVVGRWGGDEFLVVARDVTENSLQHLAERCRHLIDATVVPVASGAPLRINVSVGATMLRHGDQCDQVLDRADQMMYASKGAGKNRVAFA
ncbi:MAG: sensor domain-containing diguanylate cyclase [Acidobacteriaceae bacterium]